MGPSYHLSFVGEVFKNLIRNPKTRQQPDLTQDEENRLDHYIKLTAPFKLSSPVSTTVALFKKTAYSYDFLRCLRNSRIKGGFKYAFGDIRETFLEPTFTKSRPIHPFNSSSVLLPLEFSRHFDFYPDPNKFDGKIDGAVFRGACHQPWRQLFLDQAAMTNRINAGDTARSTVRKEFHRPFLSVAEQLRYKAIISLEGNDVASNLKWAMNSNSVVIMPQPKFETWFCESFLKPWFHYIPLEKDDYSDLHEKIDFSINNPIEVKDIIANANQYCAQYHDKDRQFYLGSIVMNRYFDLQNGD